MIKYQQGRFIDSPKYKNWSDTEKEIADRRERCLVRSSPKGNAVCQCNTPEDAIWIANRLNIADEKEEFVNEPFCLRCSEKATRITYFDNGIQYFCKKCYINEDCRRGI